MTFDLLENYYIERKELKIATHLEKETVTDTRRKRTLGAPAAVYQNMAQIRIHRYWGDQILQ